MILARLCTPEGKLWPRFTRELASAGLPVDDLGEPGQVFFAYLTPSDVPLGFGGLHVLGAHALLRSVVIAPKARGRGVGRFVVGQLLDVAEAKGVANVWLLTTTAAPLFERLGFAHADRASAPAEIRATREFSGLCPSSAAFMSLNLLEGPRV